MNLREQKSEFFMKFRYAFIYLLSTKILLVFAYNSFPPLIILAIPKFKILGFMSLSSKMLLAFKSLSIIGTLEY